MNLFNSLQFLIVISFVISLACCVFISIKHGKPLALEIVALVLSGVMLLPVCFFLFMVFTFGSIGQSTVVKTVESPNGKYYAEVIDNNQGALGGNTFVDVYKKNEINALLFKIKKKPQRVYSGEWDEFSQYLQINWIDDSHLMIGLDEYVSIEDMVPDSVPDLNNDRWMTRESDYYGIQCTYIYMPGGKVATEDYMLYRVFSNIDDAEMVYKLLKENSYEVLEEGDAYFIGWEKDVCDASIKEIVCINGNTIVSSEIYASAEWTIDDDGPSGFDYPDRLQYVLERFVH